MKRRRRAVETELPLLIDPLRLLQGVGFSMDQSLQTLGDKLRDALPVLGSELQEANVAYTHGRTRAQSLRRLSEVYADDDLTSLMQLILQVHAHGGAVQEPLRSSASPARAASQHVEGKGRQALGEDDRGDDADPAASVDAGARRPALVALATTLSKMGSP